MRRLPHPAPWLLRLSRVPREMRAEVQADLHELFAARRSNRGAVYAHWRLYHDVASLWLQRWPVVRPAIPRLTLALLRDARGDLRYAARLFRHLWSVSVHTRWACAPRWGRSRAICCAC